MSSLPTIMTAAGLSPQSPASLRAQLVSLVSAQNPGYTADLPGSLIEDIASTDVGAMVLIDQARVELVNSLTPYGANEFLLIQLAQVYGVERGARTNTSVEVEFSGPAGTLIAKGFTVSDGTRQYVVQDGGVVAAGGVSSPLFCVATLPGSFPVPVGTVTTIITSVPPGVVLTVTNATTGVPGSLEPESLASFRSRVLQAGLAVSQGMATRLRASLTNVAGVQPRLISILQQPQAQGGGWEIVVGGGDPYEVAYAIYRALFDVSTLTGSVMAVVGITAANPGVVTTALDHGYVNAEQVVIHGAVGMTEVNGVTKTVTAIGPRTFSIGDTSSFSAYVGGGVVSPNLRNRTVAINDFPNSYNVTFVDPPQQTVAVSLTWNTNAQNFVSPVAVAQLGSAALVGYVNSVYVGQPINLFELQKVFQDAISAVLPPQQLTRMVFSVSIDGVGTPPDAGTGIIAGDPEGFFLTNSTLVTVVQG